MKGFCAGLEILLRMYIQFSLVVRDFSQEEVPVCVRSMGYVF